MSINQKKYYIVYKTCCRIHL